jgi:hypothetical protein
MVGQISLSLPFGREKSDRNNEINNSKTNQLFDVVKNNYKHKLLPPIR